MNIREDVIYARQSVDRKDSISIESQIDFCKYELKGGSCRIFKDKGYSGKNTDRPEFQKLLGEIRKGKVRRVVVYKLDRISPVSYTHLDVYKRQVHCRCDGLQRVR